jgi:hypothetical protein
MEENPETQDPSELEKRQYFDELAPKEGENLDDMGGDPNFED